tara:strand:- start:6220 stop:6855 length:636 start_codon:yes stop_codon:yes gene_type:complete
LKTSFFYLHRKSKNINVNKPPLVLLLHGFGSNEEDLFTFSQFINTDATVISLRAPIQLFTNSYAWYNIYYSGSVKNYDLNAAKDIRDKIINELDFFIDKFNCDSKRVTIIGFSQGAILGHSITQHSNGKIKNLVALSGYVDKDLISFKNNNASIYISHGVNDDVIPYKESCETNKLLDENNIKFHFESFEQGHGVNNENLKSFLKWLDGKY